MLRVAAGVFIMLHGLVYLWYVVLAQRWVEYRPEMGWSGHSWLLTGMIGESATRLAATIVFPVVALAFVGAGAGIILASGWWRTVLVAAAISGSLLAIAFWDGGTDRLVEKGLLGIAINVVILGLVLGRDIDWPR